MCLKDRNKYQYGNTFNTPVDVNIDLNKAFRKRSNLIDKSTDSIRLFDGLGDGVAGISIDCYGDVLVVATQDDFIPKELLSQLEGMKKPVYWKKLSQNQKESPKHLFGEEVTTTFLIKESGASYEISMHSGYSQGIFLDQRENRKRVRARVSEGDNVLNTFAYTGAFSVCAALSGAVTTTLDLSQPYLDWGKRNFTQNELDPSDHFWCKGDTFHWLERFAKKERVFDGIILDPPTFSRDAKGKVFRVEKDYTRLVELAMRCLKSGGWLLASTNCRKLSDLDFLDSVKEGSGRNTKAELIAMPEEYTDVSYLKSIWIEA